MFSSLKNWFLKDPKFYIWSTIGFFVGLLVTERFHSISGFIFGIIGSTIAFALTHAVIEEVKDKYAFLSGKSWHESSQQLFNDDSFRVASYLIAVCVLYAVCAVSVSIASAGANAGDREESTGLVATEDIPPLPLKTQYEYQSKMFFCLLVPTLIGVRFTIGKPKK